MRRWVRGLCLGTGGLVVLWCLGGLAMAVWPVSGFPSRPHAAETRGTGASAPTESGEVAIVEFRARDGAILSARHHGHVGRSTVLLLHGVLGDARQVDALARRIREASGASVFALDLRGHGRSEGAPGDVDRIGRYGEDVEDVLTRLGREHPGGRLILAGYSMGGGIALRAMESGRSAAVDAYLLFAPLMGPDSPTTRKEAAEGDPTAEIIRVHLRRTLGLVMLNSVGFHGLDGLETLSFDVPAEFPIRGYSYRAMVSMTPGSHRSALTADEKPLLVVVGNRDSAFVVERFPEVIGLHPNGATRIVDGVDHDGLVHSPEAAELAGTWIRDLS